MSRRDTRKAHTENTFDKLITEQLVVHGGYEPRGRSNFDPDQALAVSAGVFPSLSFTSKRAVSFRNSLAAGSKL